MTTDMTTDEKTENMDLAAGAHRPSFNSTRNKSLVAAAGVAALAGAAYYFRSELMGLFGYQKIHVAPHVQAKLPIAKNLPTVPDADGNYDMDGVSFDTEGVIVGGDQNSDSPTEKQIHH